MRKLIIAATAATMLTVGLPGATVALAHGNVPPELDEYMHAAAEYRGANYWLMERIVRCETGNYDPRVIDGTKRGASGEIGPAQILPSWTPAGRRYGTIGSLFEARGGDYFAPSDHMYFLAYALTRGYRNHWHCG